MHGNIVADTSCLIALNQIESLYLLRDLFGKIIVTPHVKEEYKHKLPLWFKVDKIYSLSLFNYLCQILEVGEASVITWALENAGSLALIDDLKARKTASGFKIEITGTIGILLTAKRKKLIPLIKPKLQLLANHGFRMSHKLFTETLALVNEK